MKSKNNEEKWTTNIDHRFFHQKQFFKIIIILLMDPVLDEIFDSITHSSSYEPTPLIQYVHQRLETLDETLKFINEAKQLKNRKRKKETTLSKKSRMMVTLQLAHRHLENEPLQRKEKRALHYQLNVAKKRCVPEEPDPAPIDEATFLEAFNHLSELVEDIE